MPLDSSFVNRAAPPGSMRYFALLYAPPEKRDAATAVFVIDAEIRESAQSANHDVAHTRLQWWRQEIDRLVNANALHPATRLLSELPIDRRQYAGLHELIVAADMDLARMTYLNLREMLAYCARSGGAVTELIARVLAHPTPLDETTRNAANKIGTLVRAVEIVRDVRQDAYDGRMYLPLDAAEKLGFSHEDLREKDLGSAPREALKTLADHVREEFAASLASIPTPMRAYLRPLYVLAGLYTALLGRIAQRQFDVGTERMELGPLQKPWVAWRAARRAT
jgi:phytoene synthase